MKYHQFSQAISSLTHITGKHELVIVESGTPYIVDNILLNDMKQVVVHAYSLGLGKDLSPSTQFVLFEIIHDKKIIHFAFLLTNRSRVARLAMCPDQIIHLPGFLQPRVKATGQGSWESLANRIVVA